MKKGQKPSSHVRRVRTKKGKRKVVVNRKIKKKRKKKNYGSNPNEKSSLLEEFELAKKRKPELALFAISDERVAVDRPLDLSGVDLGAMKKEQVFQRKVRDLRSGKLVGKEAFKVKKELEKRKNKSISEMQKQAFIVDRSRLVTVVSGGVDDFLKSRNALQKKFMLGEISEGQYKRDLERLQKARDLIKR